MLASGDDYVRGHTIEVAWSGDVFTLLRTSSLGEDDVGAEDDGGRADGGGDDVDASVDADASVIDASADAGVDAAGDAGVLPDGAGLGRIRVEVRVSGDDQTGRAVHVRDERIDLDARETHWPATPGTSGGIECSEW